MRTQFAFYKSFDDVYQDLNDKQRLEFISTLLDVQFLRIKVDDVFFKDNILKHIWNAQKHSIKKSINGYIESQKNSKIKEPYLGVYDDNYLPIQIPSEGINKEEEVKEEVKEEEQVEYTMLENEFQAFWKSYTIGLLKQQGRNGGTKKTALSRYKKLREKYSYEQVSMLMQNEFNKNLGHRDLERVFTIDNMKQVLEDGVMQKTVYNQKTANNVETALDWLKEKSVFDTEVIEDK